MTSKHPRILLYSHDTYGLGHIRRSMAISHQIAADIRNSQQLIVTGSTLSGAYAIPPRTEIIKLPSLSKRSSGEYEARHLPLDLQQVIQWRTQMLNDAIDFFTPDIVLVDKSPAGAQQELVSVITKIKTEYPAMQLVLGMRDIEDSAIRTKKQWQDSGAFDLMQSAYDKIFLYGQRDFFDPVMTYQLPRNISEKMVEVGYISREYSATDTTEDLDIPVDKPLVLLTVGGGGDGYDIISAFLQMVDDWVDDLPFHTLIVTGPLMAARLKTRVLAVTHPSISIINFTPNLMHYMELAEVVISMAGYNSCVELMSLRKKTILIPRNTVREEQRIRAERMASRKMAWHLRQSELSSSQLQQTLLRALHAPTPTSDWNLNGLSATTAALQHLLTPSEHQTGYLHQRLCISPYGTRPLTQTSVLSRVIC